MPKKSLDQHEIKNTLNEWIKSAEKQSKKVDRKNNKKSK